MCIPDLILSDIFSYDSTFYRMQHADLMRDLIETHDSRRHNETNVWTNLRFAGCCIIIICTPVSIFNVVAIMWVLTIKLAYQVSTFH